MVFSLLGCIIRLESAFVDFAQTYYKQMAQQVRLHRDQLTTSHQFLKIRHQFKMGFIAEMRFDFSAALKLVDLPLVDSNNIFNESSVFVADIIRKLTSI